MFNNPYKAEHEHAHNGNLIGGRDRQYDEWYTPMNMVEAEIPHYAKHLAGKTIFCNCDDPFESNFTLYLLMHFNQLHLKRLISTGYATSPIVKREIQREGTYCLDISDTRHFLTGNQTDLRASDAKRMLEEESSLLTILHGDTDHQPGDFRSEESLSLLQQADVVIGNPPFSLFREYVATLEHYQKKYLIIGDINQITYKDFFPLIKDGKIWLGITMRGTGSHWFMVPDSYQNSNVKMMDVDGTGTAVRCMTNGRACWWTNLDYPERHTLFHANYQYKGHENDYAKYDNFDAIDISYVPASGRRRGNFDLTPYDYDGVMGIPSNAFGKLCPEQFEIVGWSRHNDENMDGGYWQDGKSADATVNGKLVFRRILIRNKFPGRNDWDAWQREIDASLERNAA